MKYSDAIDLIDDSDGEDEIELMMEILMQTLYWNGEDEKHTAMRTKMKMTIFSKLLKKKKSDKKNPCLPFQLLSTPKKS